MRRAATSLRQAALISLAGCMAMAQEPEGGRAHPERSFVAVVIGVTSYEHLPDEVELNFARSDAATVAEALQENGNYQYVFLLTDKEATREGITETIRTKAAQFTGPEDTLMVYFVGHGLGADLGVPTLLAFDSTMENGQQDGFEIQQLMSDVATWTRAGTTIFVTDAIHKNQIDGIPFYGPGATQWPAPPPKTLILSSSEASAPAKDGAFGMAFADAVSGAADENADGDVTGKELYAYLDKRFIGSSQRPVASGDLTDELVVAHGVQAGATSALADVPVVTKDYEVYAAKFVFRDGVSPTVSCTNAPVKSCDPSCYVRNFKAGTCTLTAIVDGAEVRGKTLALVPGRYDCGLRADKSLSCMPPQMPEVQKGPPSN